MNIVVVGNDRHFEEAKAKLKGHSLRHENAHANISGLAATADLVFDFLIHHKPDRMENYLREITKPVFLNSTLTTLKNLCSGRMEQTNFFGFNGMPTFFDRGVLEVTVLDNRQTSALKEVCSAVGIDYQVVQDSVGMVTPRVICQIINEAFRTVEEGTASRGDIDLAMKLGTNYPFGPFEWCKRIGPSNVRELLRAVHRDTRDDRYLICELLERED